MTSSVNHRHLVGVLVSLLLAIGVLAGPGQIVSSGDTAQTHARQTHA